jgi:transcriptional regulator with XRE-family HTH domain
MYTNSYNNWYAKSDAELAAHIGNFIRHHRLQQNLTQASIAEKAGISRSTLSLLERGETVTLATLLQVLRTLELLHILQVFEVKPQLSPMALAEEQQKLKKRASGKRADAEPDEENPGW